ncbi:MAG: FtsX-like permease family protein [Asgard group archaeon]|nr:FtsX-like permease family protein [Asgard group archaeon]
MLLRKVLRDLSQRKLRCVLTIIGLGVAVISITGFAIASESILETSRRMLGDYSANAFITVRDGPWNQSFVNGIDYIDDYEPTYLQYSSTYVNDEYFIIYMNGIDMAKVDNGTSVSGVVLDEGNIPSADKNETLFDFFAAKDLGLEIGDYIEFVLPTESGSFKKVNLTISGFAHNIRYLGYTFYSGIDIWMNLTSLQTLLEKPDVFDILFLKIAEEGDRLEIQDTISSRMEDKGLEIVIRYGYYSENYNSRIAMLNTMRIIVIFVMIIGLVIGGLLAATTIQMAIASEKEDIALMKILGGKKGQIVSIYLLEAFILGLFGAVIGLLLSILGGYIILKFIAEPLGVTNVVFVLSLKGIILGFTLPVLIAVIFSFPVILSALRVSPLDVFRIKSSIKKSKGSSKSKSMFLRYIVTNISKKKARLILNMIMISLAVSSIVGLQVTTHNVTTTIYDMYSNYPGEIIIDTPQDENETYAKNILDSCIQNNSLEDIESYECFFWKYGGLYDSVEGYFNVISMLGIHNGSNVLDKFDLLNGSLLTEADDGKNHIIITRIFKERIMTADLIVGSEVILLSGEINDTFTVVGIINDQMNEGRMVYMPLSTMHQFFNVEGKELINTIYFKLKDKTKDIEIAKALRKDENIRARGWIVTPTSYLRNNSMKTANLFILIGTTVTILSVIVAIIGGTNSFSMAALERDREIGILKLTGAKPRWIIGSFLFEGITLGTISGIIGTLIGATVITRVVCSLVSNEFLMDIVVNTRAFHVLIGICAGLITGFLATIYPGYKASATSVISALKYE